ncbi:hypothetical protein WJX72_009474 [[Myrmecia] bisecta]|uniref:Transmembrane protein n=1 Tax=[Myrmecia] bisecta TaxID=41462 RepID=A0AAW1Q3C9_9CHLO
MARVGTAYVWVLLLVSSFLHGSGASLFGGSASSEPRTAPKAVLFGSSEPYRTDANPEPVKTVTGGGRKFADSGSVRRGLKEVEAPASISTAASSAGTCQGSIYEARICGDTALTLDEYHTLLNATCTPEPATNTEGLMLCDGNTTLSAAAYQAIVSGSCGFKCANYHARKGAEAPTNNNGMWRLSPVEQQPQAGGSKMVSSAALAGGSQHQWVIAGVSIGCVATVCAALVALMARRKTLLSSRGIDELLAFTHLGSHTDVPGDASTGASRHGLMGDAASGRAASSAAQDLHRYDDHCGPGDPKVPIAASSTATSGKAVEMSKLHGLCAGQ